MVTADPSPDQFKGPHPLDVGSFTVDRPGLGLPVTVCHAWRDPAGEGALEMIPIVAFGASAEETARHAHKINEPHAKPGLMLTSSNPPTWTDSKSYWQRAARVPARVSHPSNL